MALTKTKYVNFVGLAYWTKIYEPDDFKGAVRWTLQLYMDDDAAWEKFKDLGIQKKIKEDENGKSFSVARPTTKMIAGKITYFTPPIVYDKDGKLLVAYYNEEGHLLKSFDDKDKKVIRKGEDVLIGNGSKIEVTLCVYPTGMGTGNRLESIKILDLIEYHKEDSNQPAPEGPSVEVSW